MEKVYPASCIMEARKHLDCRMVWVSVRCAFAAASLGAYMCAFVRRDMYQMTDSTLRQHQRRFNIL